MNKLKFEIEIKKMAEKRITYNVPESKKLHLERLAITASQKVGKTIKWTDIITYLIDNYSKDAFEDMTKGHKKTNEK